MNTTASKKSFSWNHEMAKYLLKSINPYETTTLYQGNDLGR